MTLRALSGLRSRTGLGAQEVALAIQGTPVTTATVDETYAGFTLTASGGDGVYTFSVHAGELPMGIDLDADTGEVAGTPTVEETQAGIVMRVTDAHGATADLMPFQIEVSAGGEVPAWVEALRAPSGDLPEFAVNFETKECWGGLGGVDQAVLPITTLESNPEWGEGFDPDAIVLGQGLPLLGANTCPNLPGSYLSAATLANGATMMMEASITDTPGYVNCSLWDNGTFSITSNAVLDFTPHPDVRLLLQGQGGASQADVFTPVGALARAVYSQYFNGTGGLVGSINGRPNISCASTAPAHGGNNCGLDTFDPGTADHFCTIWAIYALQPDVDLPAMSALS